MRAVQLRCCDPSCSVSHHGLGACTTGLTSVLGAAAPRTTSPRSKPVVLQNTSLSHRRKMRIRFEAQQCPAPQTIQTKSPVPVVKSCSDKGTAYRWHNERFQCLTIHRKVPSALSGIMREGWTLQSLAFGLNLNCANRGKVATWASTRVPFLRPIDSCLCFIRAQCVD